MKFCSKCGNQIDESANICPKCGFNLSPIIKGNWADRLGGAGLGLGIGSFVVGWFGLLPLLGLAVIFLNALPVFLGLTFSIIGIAKANKKSKCVVGLVFSSFGLVIYIVIIVLYIFAVLAAAAAAQI